MAKHIKSVHFVGIGGVGMSSLARWFKAQKWAVSGSDLMAGQITRELQKDGFRVKIGHKKTYLSPAADLVIHSQAVKPDNPELKEAKKLNIPVFSYPQIVGQLTRVYQTVAVAGAHGKSTTTALAALVLIKTGLDPTVIVGTKLREFGNTNFRAGRPVRQRGKSPYLVLEADEYGGAFLRYSPAVAIVTNIDREHLDVYKKFSRIKNAFLQFLSKTKIGGALILNRDDKIIFALRQRIAKIAADNRLRIIWYSVRQRRATAKIQRAIKIPGAHNISNALAVYNLGRFLKIPEKKILSAIGSYRGAWRRMEFRGKLPMANGKLLGKRKADHLPLAFNNLLIYDDYAHHPTEIKATLQAFREKFPKRKIICVFQPHQTKRLKLLFADFVGAFKEADALVLVPSYKVAGRDPSTSSGQAPSARSGSTDHKQQTTSDGLVEKLAAAIRRKYSRQPVFYLPYPKNLKKIMIVSVLPHLFSSLKPKSYKLQPVLVMMGAGDIVNYTDSLLKK